jgi:hypothetical protein
MQAGPSLARPARARHRHELRTLTYVTLDQANGGIVRNLTHDGIAVQAVAAVRPRQQLRVRFELRYPRLCVETRGEVVWSTFSGQCGIRFVDPAPNLVRQIDEWIFGDLLQGLAIPADPGGFLMVQSAAAGLTPPGSLLPSGVTARVLQEFEKEGKNGKERTNGRDRPGSAKVDDLNSGELGSGDLALSELGLGYLSSEQDDGLVISPPKMKIIELRQPNEPLFARVTAPLPAPATPAWIPASANPASMFPPAKRAAATRSSAPAIPRPTRVELDWLSQPLSGRSLAWTVDTLVVTAATLLFALVFLSVTREAPKWPYATSAGGAMVIGGLYWGFFKLFGGTSLGERLARLSEIDSPANEESGARFR